MTKIHQWRKMNFSALSPCFIDHLFLVSDFRQLPCRDFLLFFRSFSTAALAFGIFDAWGIGIRIDEYFVAHIRYCSVDDGLIDRNDRSEKQIDVSIDTAEVYWLLSTSFAFQLSSLYDTGGTKYWMTGLWEIQSSCVLQFCPKIHQAFHCKFRTTSFRIQALRKTNDREGICEHNSQSSVNCVHIFLLFLVCPIQCHCTLTWRWSCLGSAQVHTLDLSLDFESSRGGPTLWFLWILSTRTPSACRRFDSYPWSDCFPNTTQSYSSRSQQDHLPFSLHRVQSRRRGRLWRWCTDKLDRTRSVSTST